MHGLDRLLSRPSQLQVLRALYRADAPLTGREIERRTGLSNRATMQALEGLVDTCAVHCESTPQANWYTLNTNHYLIARGLRPAFEAEELFWDDLRKTIRRVVHPRPLAAVATGPLARDESDVGGKLQLTLVFSTGRNRVRAFRDVESLEEEVWNRYALQISANLLDANTVDRDEYDSLWRRVEREGILLFGTIP